MKKPDKFSGKFSRLAARVLKQSSRGKSHSATNEENRRLAGSALTQRSREKSRSAQTIDKIVQRHQRVLKSLADK